MASLGQLVAVGGLGMAAIATAGAGWYFLPTPHVSKAQKLLLGGVARLCVCGCGCANSV